MWNPSLKNLCLMSSFITFEQDKAIVEKYDRKTFHHLHPCFENVIVDQGVDEECVLGIFEMTTCTNYEQVKELVNREIFYFQKVLSGCERYQISYSVVEEA